MVVNEDFLLDEQEQEQEQERRFVVDDDNKACWALRKIKEKQEKIEQKKELAETQVRQINEWLESETEKLEKSIEFLKSLLHEYAVRLREKEPGLKTHSLPFGDLQFRKQQPEWKYDEEKLLKSLKESELTEYIRIKESVDKANLKKSAVIQDGKVVEKNTGIVLDGVIVEERPEKFDVKVR